MSKKDPSTRINSKVFSAAMDAWAEKAYGPGFKKTAANIDLAKILPEPVDKETVRTWRYKRNPAVGHANLECINRTLGIDVSFKSVEEENNMTSNKPLTVQSYLALEIYRHMFNFLESVTFNSTFDEIEGNFYELQGEIKSRVQFLSSALRERIETALDEIVLPLLNEDVFSAEYTLDIGHDTPEGFFHVDNLPLLVRTHEEIMSPYKTQLTHLGKDILMLI